MTIEKCWTCKHAFITGKDRLYCKKSLADKDDCREYDMAIETLKETEMTEEQRKKVLDAIDAAEELESITGYKITSLDWFKALKELVADELDYSKHIPVDEKPCEDVAISRQAVFALAKEECETAIIPYKRFINGLNALPPVTPKQKMGKWIVYKDCEGKTRRCVCDQCGYETGKYTWKNPNFCENCGAKMEGDSE